MTPRGDLQAPDLYIPLMSWITFILLVGWTKGTTQETFDTENLVYVQSKTLFAWIFESLLIWGLFSCFQIGKPAFLELLAYTGYKFVVLSPIVLAEHFLGYMPSYAVMCVMCICFSYFYFMTLKRFASANKLS
jgi:protein transport protein YIF1